VNTGATVDHDCTLESFCHLAPGVHLCGGVCVGEGALLAVGSSAVPNVRIGAWATIGAGAVVVEDLPNEVVAVGLPAKPR
jgi:acetyltransferase-like isoleucine patch superfamily enzyme